VPLAVQRAGLKVEVCDIQTEGFDFQPQQLLHLCRENPDILAVVPAHLGGIPADLDAIGKIAADSGAFLIEDCAQSLGAEYKGRYCGAYGDFSFFSFCRGKGLTIYEGGLIAAKEKYAGILEDKVELLARENYWEEGLKILELMGYWLFYRPSLFWIVFRLPRAFWELAGNKHRADIEYFTQNFPLYKVSQIRKDIASANFRHLGEQIEKQREKVELYLRGLEGVAGIKAVKESGQDRATYPYLTLLFADQAKKEKTRQALSRAGLGCSRVYASPITEYSYLKGIVPDRVLPQARHLAQSHLTVSTSAFLKNEDILDQLAAIKKC
jgi:dTDP-4-amino-4,6-dideoxygalactose transaminase